MNVVEVLALILLSPSFLVLCVLVFFVARDIVMDIKRSR